MTINSSASDRQLKTRLWRLPDTWPFQRQWRQKPTVRAGDSPHSSATYKLPYMRPTRVQILNATLDNLTLPELLERFESGLLVTPNVDHLMKLQHDAEFYRCYQQAQFTVCDSRIVFVLSRLLFPRSALRAQITGSDFFPAFCRYHASRPDGAKVFLLGGSAQSVTKAAAMINQRSGAEIVVGYYSPPFGFERDPEETARIIEAVNQSGADTLAVGVGAPKQEKWICAHRHKLPGIARYLAIGATIEFESGELSRSPRWMTSLGLEWLYRLTQEPRRLTRRYLIEDIPFFWLLLKQRLGVYRNPLEQE